MALFTTSTAGIDAVVGGTDRVPMGTSGGTPGYLAGSTRLPGCPSVDTAPGTLGYLDAVPADT